MSSMLTVPVLIALALLVVGGLVIGLVYLIRTADGRPEGEMPLGQPHGVDEGTGKEYRHFGVFLGGGGGMG